MKIPLHLFALGLSLTATGLSAASPETTVQLVNANDRTRSFLQAKMAEMHIPALQVAVVANGRLVMSEAYGIANIEQRIPATRHTLFPINSATKSFTAVAIMQLVEAGKVDLDAPVSRYLEKLPTAWQGVKIRQLLAHTSGLPNIVDENGLVGGGSEEDAWNKVQSLPMERDPGTSFSYNQTNYLLLGRIIERLGNLPFEKFIATRQFAVAGMTNATFADGYDIVPGRAGIYVRDHAGRAEKLGEDALFHWIDDIPVSTRAGAGIYTSAEGLANWIIALQSGRLLTNKSSVARMWQPDILNDGSQNNWAMGWPILTSGSHRAVGGIGGARSTFVVYPDEGISVVLMTNLVGSNPQNLVEAIADYYRTGKAN